MRFKQYEIDMQLEQPEWGQPFKTQIRDTGPRWVFSAICMIHVTARTMIDFITSMVIRWNKAKPFISRAQHEQEIQVILTRLEQARINTAAVNRAIKTLIDVPRPPSPGSEVMVLTLSINQEFKAQLFDRMGDDSRRILLAHIAQGMAQKTVEIIEAHGSRWNLNDTSSGEI